MRLILALVVGKLLAAAGKVVGKSTNLPGEAALKICPDLMGRMKFAGKILAVTGSNGKTTTANMIAQTLKDCGYSVANNAKGSNLLGGVATTLLVSSTMRGKIREDFVILEVDERFSRLIFKFFTPDFLLVTNLFRDQLTRNGNVDVIIGKLHEAIRPQVKLILNGNDPIASLLAPENPRVYYSMARTSQSSDECPNITHDAKVCPKCLSRLDYSFFHYNHIGEFNCPVCGYVTPEPEYFADDVDFETGEFSVGGTRLRSDYKAAFHFLNVTAAFAACRELGVEPELCAEKLSAFRMLKQRYDEFNVGDRKAYLILSKNQNPVSFDRSIAYLRETGGEKTVIIYVNNINHTNHKDTTWLYDISFEQLRCNAGSVVCCGPRAYDLAVRMELADFDGKILVEPDVRGLRELLAQTEGDLFILTEIYDANRILEVIR